MFSFTAFRVSFTKKKKMLRFCCFLHVNATEEPNTLRVMVENLSDFPLEY